MKVCRGVLVAGGVYPRHRVLCGGKGGWGGGGQTQRGDQVMMDGGCHTKWGAVKEPRNEGGRGFSHAICRT